MSADIKNYGKIMYVEPTNFFDTDTCDNSTGINFPYEDYNMAVDLSIRISNRYSCGLGLETNDFNDYNFSTQTGSISFLSGSKIKNGKDETYLTTNYTDINLTNPSENTSECFGIESITITYDSWMFPTVDIKFVDVRGASVMCPAENGYYNEGAVQNTKMVYRSLFMFPRPIFTLKVKGFYGAGATFRLANQDVKISFDQNTGNFNIDAKFIGYMFGIYTDMPITYVSIAPYTESGMKYWNENINNGKFTFVNSDNSRTPMVTIPELRKKLAEVSASSERASAAQKGQEVQDGYNAREEAINRLKSSFPFDDWEECYNYIALYSENGETSEIEGNIKNYSDLVTSYNSTYNTSFKGFSNLISQPNCGINKFHYQPQKHKADSKHGNEEYIEHAIKPVMNEDIRKHISNFEEKCKKKTNGDFYILLIQTDALGKFKEDFNSYVNSEIEYITKQRSEEEKKYKEEEDKLVEKLLGFRPSIKNMYNLVFAHMETFMANFYEKMKNIKSQLESDREKRLKSHFGLSDGDTDLEKDTERGKYMPPFTGIYKSKDGSVEKKEAIWIGDLVNGDETEESKLVNELLNGAKLYFDTSADVERFIEGLSESNLADGTAPSTDIQSFIPLTIYDFITKSQTSNPYLSVQNQVSSNGKATAIEGSILGLFALRSFYYLCSQHNNNEADAKAFGRLEAINLYKAIRDNYSNEFLIFIKKYADNDGRKNESDNYISLITGDSSKNEISKAWDFNGININKSMFYTIPTPGAEKLGYCLYKDGKSSFIPIGISGGIEGVKGDYSSGTESLKNNTNYLYACENYELDNITGEDTGDAIPGQLMKDGTFTVIEARNYIEKIIDNISEEVNKESNEIGNRAENYGNGESDLYGGLEKVKKTLRNYSDNFKTSMEGVTYLKNTVVVVDSDWNETSQGKNDIGKMIAENSDLSSTYIKYISTVDEDVEKTIFEDDFYKKQTDSLVKAYLFLQSVPLRMLNCGVSFYAYSGNALKLSLLREGSYYWYEYDGIEKIVTDGYKKASSGYTYIRHSSSENQNNTQTYYPIKSNDSNSYKSYRKPSGVTKSRITYLKKYFENWAKNSFESMEIILKNKNYYKNGEYKDGFDVSLVKSGSNNSTEANKIQNFAKDLFFSVYTVFDLYDGIYGTTSYGDGVALSNMQCYKSSMKSAFIGFMEQLYRIYGGVVDDAKNNKEEFSKKIGAAKLANPFDDKNVKLSTYLTLKSLYDKWLCSPYNGTDTWKLSSGVNGGSDFDNFKYIDSFYEDIGYRLNVNIEKTSTWLSSCLPTSNVESTENVFGYTGKSVYDFIYQVAVDCGGMLLALPQQLGVGSAEDIKNMFRPISINSNWDRDGSSFVFIYTYEPSKLLGDRDTSKYDMNGWSKEGDGFDLTNEEISGDLFKNSAYNIPAFGVTYAKQNQSIFTNITLNMDSPGTTEAEISSTYNIASKASQGPREMNLYGQDLYRVYSNYAYTCSVESLGNIQIMPLMYFQLNNIPMWKGAYMIKKVSHSISAGSFKTTFEGVRQNRFIVPIADTLGLTIKEVPSDTQNMDKSSFKVNLESIQSYNGVLSAYTAEYMARYAAQNGITGKQYFTIEELCRSSKAKSLGIDNTPTQEAVENLTKLITECLNPIREAYGKGISITSGYRSPAVNEAVGGSSTSQHMKGQAADMQVTSDGSLRDLFLACIAFKNFDQLINERSGNSKWIHISYKANPRRTILFYNNGKYTNITNDWQNYLDY